MVLPGRFVRLELLMHDFVRHEQVGEQRGREQAALAASGQIIRTGLLTVDLANRTVAVGGTPLGQLTQIEWLIVAELCRHPGELVTYRPLALAVWGAEWVIGTPSAVSDTLRAHLARLRSRLGLAASLLETVKGHGLRLMLVPPGEVVPAPSWSQLRGRWATEHAACRHCGLTVYPHIARGFCTGCSRHGRERGPAL